MGVAVGDGLAVAIAFQGAVRHGADLDPAGALFEQMHFFVALGDVEHRIAAARAGVHLDKGLGHHGDRCRVVGANRL